MIHMALLAGLAITAATASAPAAAQETTSAAPTVIRNVNIVTLDSRGTIAGGSVVTEKGRIVRILTNGEAPPARARVVEGEGGYLIAGLIDAHVHYHADALLTRYLRYGVTTVFSLGTREANVPALLAARRRIADGTLVAPRLYATSTNFPEQHAFKSPAEVAPYLDAMRANGFELVKLYNAVPQEIFDAVTREAHKRGMGVFGHMPRTFAPEHTVSHGLDVLAHMEELYFTTFGGARDRAPDPNRASGPNEVLATLAADWTPDYSRMDPILDAMAKNRVAIIPNLVVSATFRALWMDEDKEFSISDTAYLTAEERADVRKHNYSHRDQIEKRMLREELKYPLIRRLTYEAQKKGILLLAGSDSPIPGLYPGRSLLQELRLLVAAGLTNEEALKTATINGGELTRRFDPQACIGAIRVGCEADLVLLKADPLADIRALDQIAGVMTDGAWYLPAKLDELSRRD